jgi:hypothetical protein
MSVLNNLFRFWYKISLKLVLVSIHFFNTFHGAYMLPYDVRCDEKLDRI